MKQAHPTGTSPIFLQGQNISDSDKLKEILSWYDRFIVADIQKLRKIYEGNCPNMPSTAFGLTGLVLGVALAEGVGSLKRSLGGGKSGPEDYEWFMGCSSIQLPSRKTHKGIYNLLRHKAVHMAAVNKDLEVYVDSTGAAIYEVSGSVLRINTFLFLGNILDTFPVVSGRLEKFYIGASLI